MRKALTMTCQNQISYNDMPEPDARKGVMKRSMEDWLIDAMGTVLSLDQVLVLNILNILIKMCDGDAHLALYFYNNRGVVFHFSRVKVGMGDFKPEPCFSYCSPGFPDSPVARQYRFLSLQMMHATFIWYVRR